MDFEDIRKKHGLGTKDKDKEKENKDKTTSTPTSQTTSGKLSYADIAKKHGISSQFTAEDKNSEWYASLKADEEYQKYFKNVDATRASQGWQKYLADEEAAKNALKYDVNGDGKEAWWETALGLFSEVGYSADTTLPTAGVTQTIHDLRADESYRRPNDDWNEDQKNAFGQLYEVSPTLAYDFAEETNKRNAEAKEEAALKKIAESATSNGWAGFGHTIGAIATAPLGMADFLGDLAMANAGREITPDGNVSPFEYSQAVTGGITEHLNEMSGTLNENIPIIGGKGLGDLYGLGTSIAQSMASAYTLGPGGTLVAYFGQGAASAMDDALARGVSEWQAALYGTALGAFEGIAESIGIDNLFKLGASTTIKGFLKNVLKQAGAEGMEEGLTALLSNIADNAIMQDKSNFNRLVAQYMAQGMSESEAKEKAWWDSIEGIAFDTIAGAVSGGVSGSIHTTAQTIASNIDAKNIYGYDGGANLVYESLHIDPDNTHAQRMKHRLDNGKDISGYQLNRLVETNEQNLRTQDKAKMKSAIEAQLTKLGEKGDISKLADVITKIRAGEKITKAEQSILVNSKYGRRVSTTMNPDIIEQGGYDTAWAENIGTERINAEAYNRAVETYSSEEKVTPVTKNPTAKEVVTEGKKIASEAKVTMTDSEGKTIEVKPQKLASTESGAVGIELESGEVVNVADVDFGESGVGLVYQAAMERVESGGFNIDTANVFVRGYNEASGQNVGEYINGWISSYKFGAMKNPPSLSVLAANPQTSRLTAEQRETAYNFGKALGAEKSTKIDSTVSINAGKDSQKTTKKGKVIFDGERYGKTLNERQRASLKALGVLAKALDIDIRIFASPLVNGVRKGKNGSYNPATRTLEIDLFAGAQGNDTMLFTAAHELTHHIREKLSAKFNAFADFLFEQYGKKGVTLEELIEAKIDHLEKNNRTQGKTEEEIYDLAYEEVVADSCETFLADGEAVAKIAELKAKDKTLWETIKDFFTKLAARIKAAYEGLDPDTAEGHFVAEMLDTVEQLKAMWTEMLVEASEVSNSTVGGEVDLDGNSNSHVFSDRTIIEGAGLQFIPDEDGVHYQVLDADGNPVKSVTPEAIADSPLGQLVASAKENGFLGKGKEADRAATKQYEFLAELVNMCLNYDGLAPIWETAGTMVFSSIKSNADKQYGLTIDFSTVCKKTQAIVDAMSEAMVRLGRGLTRSEVETIYLEVGKAGESTPCPVCYVFSRWMGIGGILDQMSRFQDKYTTMSEAELQNFIDDIKRRINERANTPNSKGELKKAFFDKNGAIKEGQVIADLKEKANSRAGSTLNAIAKNSDTQLKIQELKVLMENQDAKEAKKTATKIKKLEAKLVDVAALEKQFKEYNDVVEEYEAYQWLTRTLMEEVDGKWVKNEKFKPVPKDVLFDLNKGATFAEDYPLSWAFRTGKGASAGKAITPYADARVGEAIQGIASQDVKSIKTGIDLNPFLNGDTKTRNEIIEKAIVKQARQNLIGGQRYQSTSDFRYEYGSDYLITFLEMQAVGAKVQLYTKVIEAVDFLASMGADINLSVMPLSDGFITLPDGTKKLIYSSVTGIDAEAAIKKAHEYNNVQLFLVGISDEHIRLALEGTDVTFVIPFHGSGNSVHQIQTLMNLLGENLDVTTAEDYTPVQSDHVSPKQTKEQKAVWDLRVKILTGDASTLSAKEIDILNKNAYLKNLHERFYINENSEEFGIKLSKDVAEQIFPYEYWDKSLTYAEADKNGERFKEYCASMGIIPRFSGMNSKGESVGFGDFTNNKGYWKLLIDRPMYDNTYDANGNWTGYGKYHEQKRINCSNFQVKHLDPEYGSATYGEVMSKANDPKKTNMIVDRAISQFEDVKHSDRDTNSDTLYSDRVLMGSLFSGGGTLEAGLVYQMLDKEFAVEYKASLASAYTDNHGKEHMFVGDVRDFNSKEKQNVFYLHASPVCKNFSPASHSGGETTLDITTAQATARVLEEQMPQVFTVENVKRYIGSEAYNIITNKLNELGYTWDVDVYKASDYGNATKRERMIIRAVKDGQLPAKPQKASKITSWGEATRDLWETELKPSNLVKSKIEAIRNTPQLKNLQLTKLDKPLMIYDTTKSKTITFAWADELAPTLTTKCGDARIIMPDGRVYAPTPKFMGRIQGLPDDYKYPKAVTNAFTIIGNGIPTQLTKAVIGGVLDSAYEQTHDGEVLYSDRTTAERAKEYFGTTNDPSKAGYMLADGTMLNFRNEGNRLGWDQEWYEEFGAHIDHHVIYEVYGNQYDENPLAAINKFISEGNVRLVIGALAGSADVVEISDKKAPTRVQLDKIHELAEQAFAKGKKFGVSYAPENWDESGPYEQFSPEVSPDRVIANIKYYYANGTVRGGSGVYRYSDRPTDSISNRTLLANALEGTVTEKEKNLLQTYKDNLDMLNQEQENLDKVMTEIDEIRYKKSLSISGEEMSVKTFEGRAKAKAKKLGINVEDVQFKLDRSNAKYIAYAVGHGKILEADKTFRSAEDSAKLKNLWGEAKEISDKISTFDRELLKLQAMQPIKEVLKREKALAWKRATEVAEERRKEAVAKVKERAAKTQRELMDRYQESRKKGRERRDMTEMRHKIRKVVKDLNKLFKNGTKERNVKEGMKDTVASALALAEVLFNDDIKNEDIVRLGVDSVTEKESVLLNEYRDLLDMRDDYEAEIEARYDNALVEKDVLAKVGSVEEKLAKVKNRISTLNSKLADVFERERARLNKSTIDILINNLANAYSQLQNSEDSYIKNAYVETMHTRLTTLAETLGGKIVKDMDIHQLAEVYSAFDMVRHMVRTANSLFFEGRTEELMTFVSATQEEIFSHYKNKDDPIDAIESKKNLINTFSWNNLKPVYAFDRLGSPTFQKLYWDAVEADNVFARLITDAGNFLQEQRDAYGYASWDLSKATEFKLADGKVFKLTLEDMMSIYAYSKRDQADKHMTEGGFVFDENNVYSEKPFEGKKLLKSFRIKRQHAKLTETYLVDSQLIAKIIGSPTKKGLLTEEQKAYVDKMQEYFTVMGDKGNKVSRTLYGIDLFTEKNYIPLQSSKEYLNSNKQALDKTKTQVTLKNNGTTKPLKPGANNPIVLRAFDELWLEHIDTMSKYCSYVLPIENLTRVFNNVSKIEGESPMSTQALIKAVYGDGARAYFDQYITDLNGGNSVGGYDSPLMTMFSKFKATAVGASLSVIVQQPFAIIRAMDMIRPDYFVPFLRRQPNSKEVDSTWEEIKKYAPIAILKEMGGFDIGSAGTTKDYIGVTNYKGFKGKVEGLAKDSKYRKKAFDDAVMWGAAKADEIGWGIIWKAVKKEVATEQKLTPGTAEFFEAVGKRFTEVVVRTQVYDSVNSRSGIMRSKNDLHKFASSFMGEPTTTINMVYNSALKVVRAFKSKEGRKEAIGQMARTSGVVLASIVMTSLAKSLIYANRDDDDDESWTERWFKNSGDSLASDLNPLTMIPYLRDLVSIYEGWDVERPDMTLFANVITSAKRALDEGATEEEILALAGDIANAFGMPAKNVVRDVKGIINLINDHFDDIETIDPWGAFGRGWDGEKQSKTDALYEAIINGSGGEVEYHRSTYETDSDYNTAIRKALRENDSRIKEAAEALNDGDFDAYSDILNEIVEEGYFDLKNVKAAILSEYEDMQPEEESEIKVEKEESAYETEWIYMAISQGDTASANKMREEIINTHMANGKSRKEAETSINSSITSHIKKDYEKNNISTLEAKNMLVDFLGKTEEEAASRVQYWDFKKQYPNYDLSESAVSKYYNGYYKDGKLYGKSAASYGISVAVYYDYCKQSSECEGVDKNGDGQADTGTKKAQIMNVIDSLPLTNQQKDALYYLNGWSKSTLWEAPWH